MRMHPELENAFDAGLSMLEVFKLFTKHHSGLMEERIRTDPTDSKKLVHNNDAFWDNWKPLPQTPYNPECVIDSLVAELATCHPPYRRILTRELVDNPGIFNLSIRSRFKMLIHEPWKALRESYPQYTITPPVVVLRWHSELQNDDALRSICEFGSSPNSSLLLWIISIDTDIKLLNPIQDLLHPFVPFQYCRRPVCYEDVLVDAALILHHRFSILRRKHQKMFDEDEVWPSEEQMSQLIRVVAGVFETVEVMIQFIDWEDDGGPKAHLETFLAYTVDSPLPSDERPYGALDHFYTRALSNLPPHLFTVFKRVFAIALHEVYFPPTNLQYLLACLLSLGKDASFIMLPHIYRLVVDRDGNVFDYPNPWIKCFLEDPMRAAFLHILRHASNPTAMLKVMVQGIQSSARIYGSTIDRLRQSACRYFYQIGAAVASDQPLLVSTTFCHFDFRCLAHTCDKIDLSDFMKFLGMLYLQRVDSPDIVRIEPDLPNHWYEGTGKMRLPQGRKTYQEWILVHITNPKYVLLGFGDETVLAVLVTQDGYPYDRGVSIYTSAMLDYM
ncbi:hypothetical protein AGABI1DRAFT_92449 [Agaricus bisporus var. burnettii JB137-S8]|uniref:Uncharacterized protein n=1 Tax=Agaricus bisporus var. burnettii (strain JB137-S8 / ATCC MYA-4627 / FGSC 10392) TaxID=597362 RepID=K5WU05_AGABU|nr:uncharacterized protein AGABI1DRAFT_92449 [Agaricus bisporus var. burnettii JB137-S8]EKM78921.1 hypothetical protein AGABI1DRAFT_92449 [Agaricus bisporus var. burnettii JB137-S8]